MISIQKVGEKKEIKKLYFDWLCNKIHLADVTGNYNQLVRALFNTKYKAIISNDINRHDDGIALRERFADELDKRAADYNDLKHPPCSMLEMLIALADRIDRMLADECCEDQSYRWFWEMIRNLGLDQYTDEEYMDYGGLYGIDTILLRVIERTYAKDGSGGLFPLKRPDNDQRKLELWYQMNAYLLENYPEKFF